MLPSGPFQSGLPSKQIDRQAFLKKLQKAKDNMEIANTESPEQQVNSQTTTDYSSLPTEVPTTPIQTNYGSFPTDVPTTPTQETNYGSFPDGTIIADTEKMDHENTEFAAQEDDTMTEVGDETTETDQQGPADSSPLSSLESTPRQLPRRPMNMFNQHGRSIIARRYHQEVGIPQTLNISPPGLRLGKGGSDDQSESDNSDEELASPTAQAAQRKKEAVYNKPVSRLLYTPRKNKTTGSVVVAAKSVDSQQKLMEAVGESKAVITDVQAKIDHFLSQEWPEYAKVYNNAGEIVDNKLNDLHRMVNNIATTCAMLESTVTQMKEQPISNKSMDLMVEKMFGMYESRYAEAEEKREEEEQEENKQRAERKEKRRQQRQEVQVAMGVTDMDMEMSKEVLSRVEEAVDRIDVMESMEVERPELSASKHAPKIPPGGKTPTISITPAVPMPAAIQFRGSVTVVSSEDRGRNMDR
ncbi:hypothetical protein BDD12DRAFT_888677 [Trichophaea hybrida]|nr:hypothetical protein BDD12DRAFT_888677 [Trichophaea hybrida]